VSHKDHQFSASHSNICAPFVPGVAGAAPQ
jgi:hypothetical protein